MVFGVTRLVVRPTRTLLPTTTGRSGLTPSSAPMFITTRSVSCPPTGATTLADVQTAVNNALNKIGNDAKYIDAQIAYSKEKLDAMESGLGALIDADMAKESARLQALQIRQQLGTQSLSIANQAPQALLSLFR